MKESLSSEESVWRLSEDERLLLLENDVEALDETEFNEPLVLGPLELELSSSSSALCRGNRHCPLDRALFM